MTVMKPRRALALGGIEPTKEKPKPKKRKKKCNVVWKDLSPYVQGFSIAGTSFWTSPPQSQSQGLSQWTLNASPSSMNVAPTAIDWTPLVQSPLRQRAAAACEDWNTANPGKVAHRVRLGLAEQAELANIVKNDIGIDLPPNVLISLANLTVVRVNNVDSLLEVCE